MRAFEDKLIDMTRYHSEEVSKEWAKAVRSNPRTPSYHSIPENLCVQHAVDFYRNLRRMYVSEKPYAEVREYFRKYAEDRYGEGIPVHEAVYALIMIKRHIWLFADFQRPFLAGLDKQQAIGAINQTIRIFDHGIYYVVQKYAEMSK